MILQLIKTPTINITMKINLEFTVLAYKYPEHCQLIIITTPLDFLKITFKHSVKN